MVQGLPPKKYSENVIQVLDTHACTILHIEVEFLVLTELKEEAFFLLVLQKLQEIILKTQICKDSGG